MKKIQIILFFVLLQNSVFAQQIGGNINAENITLTYDKTLHFIYKTDIKYFDVGNKELVAVNKPEGLNNVLQLKANEENFNGETNVTVVCANGQYHSYILSYSNAPAFTYLSEYTTYKKPEKISICEKKSTHIIFPQRIKYVDFGNNTIKANSTVVDNIVKLQAAEQNFKETNISVVTSDNQFYTFDVDYVNDTDQLTFLVDGKTDESVTDKSVAIFNEKELKTDDRAELCAKMYKKKRKLQHLADKSSGIVLTIHNIFIHNKIIFVKIQIENRSSIRYDINFIKFYVQDKKISKKTAAQEVMQEPLFIDNFDKTIQAHKKSTFIAAFEKFTIPDDKNLIIEIQEVNGGRNFRFQIKNDDIMEAQQLK